MNKSSYRVLIILIFTFWSGLPSGASGIDAAMLKADKRLERLITLSERRISLGELLERISKQTQTTLFVNDQKPISGIQLAACFSKTPAINVLNGIWALLSSRNEDWVWLRGNKSGTFSYELSPPGNAGGRADRMRRFSQEALENYVSVITQLAHMTPAERRKSKHKISQALGLDNDALAEGFLASDGFWDHVRFFADIVPPEQQLPVIRGEQEAHIEVKALSPQAQAFVHQVWEGFGSTSDGVPDPEPKTLRFFAQPFGDATTAVVPAVYFDMGRNSSGQSCGSISILGDYFLSEGIRAAIYKAWVLPQDTLDNPLSQRVVAPVQDPPPYAHAGNLPFKYFKRAQDLRFSQLAEGASLTLLALLPAEQGQDPQSPCGHTVREFLEGLKQHHLDPIYKWHGNQILFSYPAWFTLNFEDEAVPYKWLKRDLADRDGLISLPQLLDLFSNLNVKQLASLMPDHPILRYDIQLMPFYAFYTRFPEVASAQGMPLDAASISTLLAYPQFRKCSALLRGTATALRLEQHETVQEGHRSILIGAYVRDADSQWVPLYEILQRASE